MISINERTFHLNTAHTSYRFRVTPTGHLEHLYYGSVAGDAACTRHLQEKTPVGYGNVISYDAAHCELFLETLCLEVSSRGRGDIREPFIELIFPDGGRTCDFLFEKAELRSGKDPYGTLPGSYGLPEGGHLCVTLKEAFTETVLELHYYVYEDEDVICRSARLINRGEEPVLIKRLMSLMLDLDGTGYSVTTFTGAWAREMERHDTAVTAGGFSVSSVCGSSSNRANPYFMVSSPLTEECFGFNLIYSGNHLEMVEVGAFGTTRVLSGINPDGFLWKLGPGEEFEAPEAVMTYSAEGEAGVSLNMRRFVSEHIVRGYWKERKRPIALNSWEAFYFDYDEGKLLELARAAKDVGIELFVLDDGWFGKRDDETSSLGDWRANEKKLPGGLKGFSEMLRDIGLSFGLWVEPEMVSTDSEFYGKHPDWVMEIPGRIHSEGRTQRILDLANPEVAACLEETFTHLFSSADISYVKWDMNRIFSDVYSPYLGADRQGETAHRYMLGLYRLLDTLTGRFPRILFEGCAAGGGRFDLGMLCFFPQIWASDNTDPVCRACIQKGYESGYPKSCISAHVSASPNRQTGRVTTLEERYGAAADCVLGYELDLRRLDSKELDEIREQIKRYKRRRGGNT